LKKLVGFMSSRGSPLDSNNHCSPALVLKVLSN